MSNQERTEQYRPVKGAKPRTNRAPGLSPSDAGNIKGSQDHRRGQDKG